MKVLRKIVGNIKIESIRSQESCGIEPINEWVKRRRRRRRREQDERAARMDTERLVKFSRDNIPAGCGPPGRPKNDKIACTNEEEEEEKG